MTKGELIESLSEGMEITKRQSKEIVNFITDKIYDTLISEDEVAIKELGKLKIVTRKAKKGHNPKTGQSIDIPPKKVVKFKMSRQLKKDLN